MKRGLAKSEFVRNSSSPTLGSGSCQNERVDHDALQREIGLLIIYVRALLHSTSWLRIKLSSLRAQIGFWNKRCSCSHLSRTLRKPAGCAMQVWKLEERTFGGLWVSFALGVITTPPHLSEFCQEEIWNVSLFNEADILGVISTVAQTPQRQKMLMKLLMKDQFITQCGRERGRRVWENRIKYYIKHTGLEREPCGSTENTGLEETMWALTWSNGAKYT